jgi:uncharacterized membrane protein
MASFVSSLSGNEYPEYEKVLGSLISPPIIEIIKFDYPLFNDDYLLSISEYQKYKQKYIQDFLVKDENDISLLEKEVVEAVGYKRIISDKDICKETQITFAQKLSDKVASFGGSWRFIILFGVLLTIWISFNVMCSDKVKFDPYPFILMNLILSCIAALQAPIIMMSQNRQDEKDRIRAKQDYMINLKSELEIRLLHEKMDHLLLNQQQELIKLQQQQIEKINLLLKKNNLYD